MNASKRFPAFIAYLFPVLGWLYVLFFERKNPFAMFHLRQSVGLVLFLLGVFVSWVVVGWALAWIPYVFIFSVLFFSLVIIALIFGIGIWFMGMANALKGSISLLPIFGRMANRLPL